MYARHNVQVKESERERERMGGKRERREEG